MIKKIGLFSALIISTISLGVIYYNINLKSNNLIVETSFQPLEKETENEKEEPFESEKVVIKGKNLLNEENKINTEIKQKEINEQHSKPKDNLEEKNSQLSKEESSSLSENMNNENANTPKKEEIWEVLGLTEEQYYNEPLYSWERVDFKSMSECLSKSDNDTSYLNGEVSNNCRDVFSASGKYLGVMLDHENLN